MCNRYVSPAAGDMERYWHVSARTPWRGAEVVPRAPGPFIRAQRDATEPQRELMFGQWGLVPWFAKTAKLSCSTNNARFEEITSKASFKHSWQYGKRCVIPAVSFDEPNWETGKNVWWRFRRADGAPWGLAGLWNTWTDKTSGEIVESHTLLTINADAHPLMSRMHNPDPKLGPDEQDKRSVIAIEIDDADTWQVDAPTDDELHALVQTAIARLMKMLMRCGVLIEDMGQVYLAEPDADGEEARTLRPLQAAAITYRTTFGPGAGQKLLTLRGAERGHGTVPADGPVRREGLAWRPTIILSAAQDS